MTETDCLAECHCTECSGVTGQVIFLPETGQIHLSWLALLTCPTPRLFSSGGNCVRKSFAGMSVTSGRLGFSSSFLPCRWSSLIGSTSAAENVIKVDKSVCERTFQSWRPKYLHCTNYSFADFANFLIFPKRCFAKP